MRWLDFLMASVAASLALLCAACSEPSSGPAPAASGSVSFAAVVSASVSASPKVSSASCALVVSALGVDRGFPVTAPTTKKELDAAVKELEARSAAFDEVKSNLDPEALRVGGELSASFYELAEMLKTKPAPEPAELREEGMARLRPKASASAQGAAPLYDASDWGTKNERFVAAWKGVAELCR